MTAPTFDLSGKTALVTGASTGLGAHFAATLSAAGARVIVAARRREALSEVAQSIRANGGEVEEMALDVTDTAAIQAAAPRLAGIDILINNAGIAREAAAAAQTEADWDAVIDTNLKGVFLLAQVAARAMMAHGRGGAIVNIASILGLRQASGVLPYAVSKAGVIQMTKSMALEWARFGIRVNALAPGYIASDINRDFWDTEAGKAMIKRIPQRRLGDLENLDGPLLLLASDLGAYMTGEVLAVDGGHLVSGL